MEWRWNGDGVAKEWRWSGDRVAKLAFFDYYYDYYYYYGPMNVSVSGWPGGHFLILAGVLPLLDDFCLDVFHDFQKLLRRFP